MNILFINQYYWPDVAATAQMLTDLAERLALEGHQVIVVASQKPYSGNQVIYPKREYLNSVEIVRLAAIGGGKRSGFTIRVIDFLSFYVLAVVKCIMLPRPDVVVTLTTPPMIGLVGRFLSGLKRTKHVHWCMDMFCDLLVANRLIKKGIVNRILEFLTCQYIKTSEGVIVLGKYMAERMKKYSVNPHLLHIIPVWADGTQIRPIRREQNWFIEKHNLQNKFVVLYSGNIGINQTFDTVIKAAERLTADRNILFLFISFVGKYFDQFQASILKKGLSNIRFLPYQDRKNLAYSLSAGHLHIVYFTPGKEGMKVPCKIYGIMAAGGPVLYIGNTGNEIADVVSENHIGFCIRNGDVQELVKAISTIKTNPQLWADMSRRARETFERTYEVNTITSRFNQLFLNIVHENSP